MRVELRDGFCVGGKVIDASAIAPGVRDCAEVVQL